ncbi:YGGT family protein [Actinobacteria bacterium IMCC26207]|nr:YGGT family protein [Actinobacteria bacterium IMCC26207]
MGLICIALYVFMILIFARVILSWFPPTGGVIDQIQNLVITSTEWIMGPLRRVIPPVRLGAAALDLSPLIVLLGITVLRSILC